MLVGIVWKAVGPRTSGRVDAQALFKVLQNGRGEVAGWLAGLAEVVNNSH